jgi:hypothetical protein
MKLRDCVEDIWRLVGYKSTLLIFEDLKSTSTSGSIGQQGFVDRYFPNQLCTSMVLEAPYGAPLGRSELRTCRENAGPAKFWVV